MKHELFFPFRVLFCIFKSQIVNVLVGVVDSNPEGFLAFLCVSVCVCVCVFVFLSLILFLFFRELSCVFVEFNWTGSKAGVISREIELPLRGRSMLLITRMITDRIGLHSVLNYYY